MAPMRTRGFVLFFLLIAITLFITYSLRASFTIAHAIPEAIKLPPNNELPASATPETNTPGPPTPPPHKYLDHPLYKPVTGVPPPIVDNFPLAATAHSASDLPPIPPWNRPPKTHVLEKTPLFIGFTRNWRLLQQVVVSYITAGWPPEDIFVFENTGTMYSNKLRQLGLQNPFFLNHTRLSMFGVNVVVTPTLLTFAQLQNFFLWTAIENDYPAYFWGHMDVIALPLESRYTGSLSKIGKTKGGPEYTGFKSIYSLAVEALRSVTSSSSDPNSRNSKLPWATRFFAYDRLALVNRAAYEAVGGWDTHIPFYQTDCDMYDRLVMNGYDIGNEDVFIGNFTDVADSLDDLIVLYRKKDMPEPGYAQDRPQPIDPEPLEQGHGKAEEGVPIAKRKSSPNTQEWESDVLGSSSYRKLLSVAAEMNEYKNRGHGENRLDWQRRQTGGKGEPFYQNYQGFEIGIQKMTEMGRNTYSEKWGHRECDLLDFGRQEGDEWRVEKDWERH